MKKLAMGSLIPVSMFLIVSCGAKDKATEVANELNIKARINKHWLMTESSHASKLEKWATKESVVLTFKDGKAAFSPTDSAAGVVVYNALKPCTAAVRPFTADNNQIVFQAIANPACPETRVTVQQLDDNTLKFPDPTDTDIIRTFVKIDDAKYNELVKPSEQRP